jgi:hypothetical protein
MILASMPRWLCSRSGSKASLVFIVTEAGALERLTRGANPFLGQHHLAAALRLEHLVQRACLSPRLTMSYDPSSVTGRGGGNIAAEVSDTAASARGRINALAAALPHDCWDVVFDVCGLGFGLQDIETRRQWPRRSAKLVLRIGLEQLAREFGMAPHIAGAQGARIAGWMEQRLPLIAERRP